MDSKQFIKLTQELSAQIDMAQELVIKLEENRINIQGILAEVRILAKVYDATTLARAQQDRIVGELKRLVSYLQLCKAELYARQG